MGPAAAHPPAGSVGAAPSRTILVASSAGGLNALLVLLPALPRDFPASVICVQHMHPHQPSFLVQILARRCVLPVEFVEPGSTPLAGHILVAPPGRHVMVGADGRLELGDAPPVNHVRPSADLLFSSAAAVMGKGTVAVVLTGTGHDGAAGAAAVCEAGGTVVVQSPADCEFPGMVEATMELVEPDLVLPIAQIAPALERMAAEAAA
ncbi:MAG TPA: chemotaxis protein CheB [Candidatus Dormibacteraeota bacterium]|nr:chemotaxis protein CheB [Candidatus Dormibacteraeota bacterium]